MSSEWCSNDILSPRDNILSRPDDIISCGDEK